MQYELRLVLDLPANISYRLVARYINMKQTSFPVYGNVAQGEMTEDIRFTLDGTNACTPHCYSEATLANNTAAHLMQQTGQLTVTLSLDGVHFLLVSETMHDSIFIVIPMISYCYFRII